MKSKKAFQVTMVTMGLSLMMSFGAHAEYYCTYPGGGNTQRVSGTWSQDERGKRFVAEDGQEYVAHWLYYKNTDYPNKIGVWCYFDEEGYMMQNEFLEYEGEKYFLGEDGVVKRHWFVHEGYLYLADLNGKIYTSANSNGKTHHKDGKDYTLDAEGHAISKDGEYDEDTKKMISEEQAAATGNGWKSEGSKWTYLRDGQKLTGSWLQEDGNWYYLDEDGYMVTGKVKEIDGDLYTFLGSGIMRTSGQKDYKNDIYDIQSDGKMVGRGIDKVLTARHASMNKYNPYVNNQTVQWINATYAIYTRSYGGNIKAFGGVVLYDESVAESARNRALGGLPDAWGVTDRASADRVLENLIASGNATGSAWDYSRAVSNLGLYYQAGYYTETEALDKALEVARVIQTRFTNWDAYNQSYLDGYNAWKSEYAAPREYCLEELKESQHNPFAIDWNLNLEKGW